MDKSKKIFPTKLPYCTKKHTYIPDDMLYPSGLVGNDMFYLIAYYLDENKSHLGRKEAMLNACKKSRTSEWRRIKRLKRLKLI